MFLGVFFQVCNELGYGFLESVYVEALARALRQSGLRIDREVPLTVRFRGRVVGGSKQTWSSEVQYWSQVLNYLRATVLEVGLLVNFGPRPQFNRLLFDNHHKYCRRIRGPNGCAGVTND